MRESLASPNDRLRDGRLQLLRAQSRSRDDRRSLLAALDKEQAEFVRPALVRALAALGARSDACSQALLREVGRGEDFFRSAVIEALGDYKARYAFDALDRGRQARRSAAGRCGAGARKDRRQARARRRWPALQRTAPRDDAAVDRGGDLPARRQLRVARELPGRDAEVRRQEPRLSRSCCAAPPPASARSPSPATPRPLDALFDDRHPVAAIRRARRWRWRSATVALRNTPLMLTMLEKRSRSRRRDRAAGRRLRHARRGSRQGAVLRARAADVLGRRRRARRARD